MNEIEYHNYVADILWNLDWEEIPAMYPAYKVDVAAGWLELVDDRITFFRHGEYKGCMDFRGKPVEVLAGELARRTGSAKRRQNEVIEFLTGRTTLWQDDDQVS